VLHSGQIDAVAALLTRAFSDDPLVRAICGGSAARAYRQMEWSFRLAVRGHCLSPQPAWTVTDTSGQICGVALVSRPSMHLHAPPDTLYTIRGLLHVGLRAARRGMQAGSIIASHAPAPPFVYLRTLGVDSQCQRRGYGSRLLRHVLIATPPAWPLYLETAKEENLSFYGAHGLQCVGQFSCLGTPIWRLLRKPHRE
jgi:ribosomal protein S18 acetylase RimI-like enzyme